MTAVLRHRLEKERDRVFGALESAARMVGIRDAYLLENDLREEAIIHRLAHYLEEGLLRDNTLPLENFSVDCEYNSGSGYLRKALQINWPKGPAKALQINWPKGSQSQLRKRDQHVRPDIIVHQRGRDLDHINLLMVEVKKSSTVSQASEKFATFEVRSVPRVGFGLSVLGICLLHQQDKL